MFRLNDDDNDNHDFAGLQKLYDLPNTNNGD